MFRPQSLPGADFRRGAVLLVVLAFLTLFAAVGISFVLYANTQSAAARIFREAEVQASPDVDPELLLAYFLGQLIYDVDDRRGVYSALRGHSLARSMYGWNDDSPWGNSVAFNGTGRLHGPGPFPGRDDYQLINYTFFPADGFLRDPERLGPRARPDPEDLAARAPFTGGFNAPYTYPDLNSLFLAAVRAGDGRVLMPSMHRPWLFGSLDAQNPNWTNREGKYLLLRPRPIDMGPGFPYPEDDGGDVKNLADSPGGNDSCWLDLDFPVLIAPDGRKYKPLFAPLVLDLDNRVNVNVHGNTRGAGGVHLSNQGWGPWEVNPGGALTEGLEWAGLLDGNQAPPQVGRYGADRKPASTGGQAPPVPVPHVYGQADFDGSNDGPGGTATGPLLLPGSLTPPYSCFPAFPAGYGNGSGDSSDGERWEHPMLHNSFRPAGDDRVFAPSNLEAPLRYHDRGSPALTSELFRLCPTTFRDARSRRLVTSHSLDLDRPGIIPWLFDRDASAYRPRQGAPYQAPTGPPEPFPALALRRSSAVPANSEFQTPQAQANDPRVEWRSADAALGRVDLNRFLPPYPHQGQGLTRATYRATPLVGSAGRFDDGAAAQEQFRAAQAARQKLADDIYRRLLAVTGVAAPIDAADPTDDELTPRRWLAQLAVNCVDFLDEDDLHTPLLFYTAQDAGDPAFDAGAVSAGNLDFPRYWVFGTELPRVLLNEVLTEYEPPQSLRPDAFDVKVWVELLNPLPAGPLPPTVRQEDAEPVPFFIAPAGGKPGFSPFRVVIANTNPNPGGPLYPRPGSNDNVLGTPDIGWVTTQDDDFAHPVGTVGDPAAAVAPALAPQGFFLLGPPGTDARDTIRPPRVPDRTPWLQSPNLRYGVGFSPPNTWLPDHRPDGLTVLLRRLANPHLPPASRPAIGGAPNPLYNPFVTVDYLEGIPLNNAGTPAAVFASQGKRQPYAAGAGQIAAQAPAAGSNTGHTLGRTNDPLPASGHYDWLAHLDRQVVSPMELLLVSGYPPSQLTHQFVNTDAGNEPGRPSSHLVSWFDQGNRLYRLFEFLQTHDRAAGVTPSGRVPGKINLNTVWDPEIFRALCDPQPANHFTLKDVDAIFARLVALRTPSGVPGPGDRPFGGMAVGNSPKRGDPLAPPEGDPLFPEGSGIDDTLLRSAAVAGGPDTPRLFELSEAPHPYLRYQLLTKIFNNVTTRSNVFAVWVTVGFFEVTDDTTRPIKLGPEIGRAGGRHIRHRLFALIDRTNLTRFATRLQTPVDISPGQPGVAAAVQPAHMSGTSANGRPWSIQAGSVLVIEPNTSNEETVVVTAATATSFTATFSRSHPGRSRIISRGNPGPWPRYDPRGDPEVVPYISVVQ